jgi:hypothetical protein
MASCHFTLIWALFYRGLEREEGKAKKPNRQDRAFKPPSLCAGNELISVGL